MRSEDLQYFLAVASMGKLGQVSDQLGISQPGLTKAIVRLETELGSPLFVRTGRGMQLTEFGQAFERRARRMTLEVSEALRESRTMAPLEGVLRLGVAPALIAMTTEVCAQLIRNRPLLRIDLMVQITDYLEIALSSGRIDVAVASQSELFGKEFNFNHLARDEIAIVAPVNHPLMNKPLKLADLGEQLWALPHRDIAMRRHLDSLFREQGLSEPMARMEWEWGAGVYEVIAQAQMLTIASPYLLSQFPAQRLAPLDVRDFHWTREVGLLTRKDQPMTPIATDFVDRMRHAPHRDMLFARPS